MKNALIALKLFLCMTALTGILYPFAVWAGAQVLFKAKAEGSLVSVNGAAVGSGLLGQEFSAPGYFWSRPSATGYNPMPSGGSNLSFTSERLKAAIQERAKKFQGAAVPSDLLLASGSGLDPHISPAAALIQCGRVAASRGVSKGDIISLIDAMTEQRQAGFLGEPRVNVLALNLMLDRKYPR